MIVSTQITSTVIFVFADFLVSKLLRGKVLFINRKEKTVKTVKSRLHWAGYVLRKEKITAKFGMRNFQDTFETRKQSFISIFLMNE